MAGCRCVLLGLILLWSSVAFAAGSGECGHYGECDTVALDATDQPSLQRGLKTYVNYCMGCHGARYARFERTAADLNIPRNLFMASLVFDPDKKVGDLMDIAMRAEDAEKWFGVAPPDLTLIARARTPEYLYTYLRTFYSDPARPYGVNNQAFPDVAMPNVLASLQGEQRQVCRQVPVLADNGGIKRDPVTYEDITRARCDFLEVVPGSGAQNPEEFDRTVADLVNFLHYLADPSQEQRQRMGGYVLFYLLALMVLTYMLHREYHKDTLASGDGASSQNGGSGL